MKTLATSLSLALVLTGIATTLPAQAATRHVELPASTFAERCDKHGGLFSFDGPTVLCQTITVPVACEYLDASKAHCRWPGVDSQLAVNRLIGLPNANAISSSSGGGGGSNGGHGGVFSGPGDFTNPDNGSPNWQGPKDFQSNW